MGRSTEAGRVLVVDNYQDWRRALRRILLAEGFEVEVAESREEALEYLRAQIFDLIILDVVLEGTRPQTYEGLGLLQQIEPICNDEGTLVVMISGFQCPEELQEQLGRSCVLETLDKRSIEIDALVALVQQGVTRARQSRAARRSAGSVSAT